MIKNLVFTQMVHQMIPQVIIINITSREGDILERYKNYNGFENNTPIEFSDNDRGNTTEPDTEDINRDQSMNTIDSYFEYRVPIFKGMQVGNHPLLLMLEKILK